MIEARRPDIVVVDKVKKETMIIDMAIPGDTRVCDKEQDQEIQLVKRRNWQIIANEKDRDVYCDVYCSWSIRNYNNKV